jgi:hypothetical protein
MAELDSETLESAPEGQAVKAKFNPWWIVGVALLVLAVVLGFRSSRSKPPAPPELSIDGDR